LNSFIRTDTAQELAVLPNLKLELSEADDETLLALSGLDLLETLVLTKCCVWRWAGYLGSAS